MAWGASNVITYGSVVIAALIIAVEEALKRSPTVSAKLPRFMTSANWSFVPLALLIVAGIFWVIKEARPALFGPAPTVSGSAKPSLGITEARLVTNSANNLVCLIAVLKNASATDATRTRMNGALTIAGVFHPPIPQTTEVSILSSTSYPYQMCVLDAATFHFVQEKAPIVAEVRVDYQGSTEDAYSYCLQGQWDYDTSALGMVYSGPCK